MNGIYLLFMGLTCLVIWWGTSNYYKQIIRHINKSYEAKLFEAERMINRK